MDSDQTLSVIVPCYNASRFLEACFHSIEAQSVLPDEAIFVDDASTDETVCLLKRLSASSKLNCRIIQLNRNSGPSAARNRALEQASGTWLCFHDADDHWEPEHLESLFATQRKSGASVVYSEVIVKELTTGKVLYRPGDAPAKRIPEDLYFESFIMPSQVMFSRQFVDAGVRFDETIRHGEDADFLIHLARAGGTFASTGQPTYHYFKHDDTLSQDAEKTSAALAYRLQKYKHYGDIPTELIVKQARKARLDALKLSYRSSPLRALRHLCCLVSGNHRFH